MRWSQFLMFVALCSTLVVVAATCKPGQGPEIAGEANDTSPEQRQEEETKDCVPENKICKSPCEVKLVVTDNGMDVKAVPDPVYVRPLQVVTWSAVGTKTAANVIQVHFRNPGEPTKPGKKTNDKKQTDPACSEPNNKCEKQIDKNFTPCASYFYDAVVKHGTQTKTSDPEMVIAGTNTIVN